MGVIVVMCAIFLGGAASAAQKLPAVFEHHRVLLEVSDAQDETIRIYTDTGGGWNAIRSSVAQKWRLPVFNKTLDGKMSKRTPFPTVLLSQGLPKPFHEPAFEGKLVVVEDDKMAHDLFLGSRWFAGKVWRWDYLAKMLSILDSSFSTQGFSATSMAFRDQPEEAYPKHFPRVQITVDGEMLDVLFDTGAAAKISSHAKAALMLPEGTEVGTSFITRTIYEGWKQKHPDWPVIVAGERRGAFQADMIQVPFITIAGVKTGAVWFTVREDKNFTEFMSSMTDEAIYGAIGGSALRYLCVIADYPGKKLYVKRESCAARGIKDSVTMREVK